MYVCCICAYPSVRVCALVHSCMRAYVSLSPCRHRDVSFEVCLLCRSLAENTGMAICDTIDTWHVNIDNNSVIETSCRFALSYLQRLWLQTQCPLCSLQPPLFLNSTCFYFHFKCGLLYQLLLQFHRAVAYPFSTGLKRPYNSAEHSDLLL